MSEAEMAKPGQHHHLYRSLNWVMVRTPLLPVEEYLTLGERTDEWPADPTPGTLLPSDPRIYRALAVGAGDLMRALEHPPPKICERQRLANKLTRYLIRMSTRPTPYGLFAGVAIAEWKESTNLELARRPPQVRARPDMGWLLSLVAELERRPEVRAGLHWFANPAVLIRDGRVLLTERAPVDERDPLNDSVSLRATRPVREALALACKPIQYGRLVEELQAATGAGQVRVEGLLSQLWEQTVLLTDLRPPVITKSPAHYVIQRLAKIPDVRDVVVALTELLEEISAWNEFDEDEGAGTFGKIIAKAESVHPVPLGGAAIQVDMAIPLAGRALSSRIATEAIKAAELLLQLSPPVGDLKAYRHAFLARYGIDRHVPILELLDPEEGLGLPGHGHAVADPARESLRQQTLRTLALDAIRDGRREVKLDQQTLRRLGATGLSANSVPSSLDLAVFVLAGSADAIDSGDFQLVVGPNVGANAAGRNVARFADLLGADANISLREAVAGEAGDGEGRIWAEVVYQPRRRRSANVVIRPLVRDWVLALDCDASTSGAHTIPMAELMVGIREDRFILHYPAKAAEVIPCAGHMLNSWQAPAIVRFLDQLSRDGRNQISHFDWGLAADFPFLPRVRVGRIVLALARWRLDAETFDRSLDSETLIGQWRERWRVPRYVYLAAGDNRLMIDLERPAQAEQIRAEADKLPPGRHVVITEALPDPSQAWLPGPGGHFIAELMVPMVVTADSRPSASDHHSATSEVGRTTARPVFAVPANVRLRPPGSDWLSVKLYYRRTYDEELIAGPLREFCTSISTAGLAKDWYFLRYSDPEPHIRLRFHGEPNLLVTRLIPELFSWAAELITHGGIRRYCLDTYEREVSRYGGPEAISVAERLFAADSTAVVELLHQLNSGSLTLDPMLLATQTVDDLLAAFGFNESTRLDWYRDQVVDRRRAAKEYRTHKASLRLLLGDPGWLAAQPGGTTVGKLLLARRHEIRQAAVRLDELDSSRLLERSKHSLAQSFVHMHCNRLLANGRPDEIQVIALLRRGRESLYHAPIAPSHQATALPGPLPAVY